MIPLIDWNKSFVSPTPSPKYRHVMQPIRDEKSHVKTCKVSYQCSIVKVQTHAHKGIYHSRFILNNSIKALTNIFRNKTNVYASYIQVKLVSSLNLGLTIQTLEYKLLIILKARIMNVIFVLSFDNIKVMPFSLLRVICQPETAPPMTQGIGVFY